MLKFGLSAAALAAPGAAFAAEAYTGNAKAIAFTNIHTGESFKDVYWEQGKYVPDALNAVDRVLRDYRTGDVHPIHPELLDLLGRLSAKVETGQAFQVISGYRSPKTNAMLHERSTGVASKSLHMQGMAIDIRLADVGLDRLHRAALDLQGGGVGYYPGPDFVHVDVGPVRRW
jgi:uncharacterized protein YcbK (DUF882 family)